MIKNPKNSYEDPYRKQLTPEHLDEIIDRVHDPFDFIKRVYYSKMGRRYLDQIAVRVDERVSRMPDLSVALRWKKETLRKLKKHSAPVRGYEYDERTSSLVTTANLRSFRMSTGAAFSGTLETPDKRKRNLGYAAGIVLTCFALYGGYLLGGAITEASDVFGDYIVTIESYIDGK